LGGIEERRGRGRGEERRGEETRSTPLFDLNCHEVRPELQELVLGVLLYLPTYLTLSMKSMKRFFLLLQK